MTIQDIIVLIISNALMYAAPMIFTAIGAVFSERSGVVNIGLEGIMVVGAFVAALVNLSLGTASLSPWLALLVGGLAGLLYSLIHAVATVSLRADHTISGTVLNLAATGLAVFLCRAILGRAQTGPLAQTFGVTTIPVLSRIPLLGPLLFTHTSLPAWLGLVLAVLASFILYKTKFGLHLRSAGEHPLAAETVGINVYAMKYAGVLISGFLAGIGGAIQVQAVTNDFSATTVAGQGFMAMAAMVLGAWHPLGAAGAAIFFGFAQSLAVIGAYIPVINQLPSVVLKIFPYLLTILVVSFVTSKGKAPKANGKVYVRRQ
ncbi:sugar ABC transporter permease [Aerococcus urinaehominis]|uniref:Sugar ABC transporter permease n=1 Tax=Aerococcus urinaehominis TaxID=128944 RepID=A0A109RG69_9LACT|nr:ABC transporter permease [Aerococcus urinaehominis]AMB98681.1 sugar ABC transporter permease [Aerococcus urinaehominis]SDL98436.1 nucleoside ABC transporter membrane protein [Aerococcus urinaehominis]